MNIRAIANSWASHIAAIDTRSVAVADYLERELRQLMGLSSLSDDNADQPAPTETGVRCGCNEFRADGTCVHKHPCPFVPNYRRVLSCAYTLAEALDSPGLSDEENADLTAAAKYVLSLGDVLASPAPTETGTLLLLRAWVEAERVGSNRHIDSGSSAREHWVGYRHALDMVLSRIEYPSHPNDALAETAPQGAPDPARNEASSETNENT